MANIAEVDNFDAVVYEIATTDPVEGGPGGIANAQAQALANRTLWLKNRIAALIFQGQVLELDVPDAFIVANFNLNPGPTMGLGTNLCLGFALCNGNNGTKDRNGLVSIGYGPNYPSMGAVVGSANTVLPAHTHTQTRLTPVGSGGIGFEQVGDDGHLNYQTVNTGSAGTGNGVGTNIQPSIVTLFIMKL